MIVDFAQETWSQVRDEALPLMQAHWEEMQFGYPLDINYELIDLVEKAGAMRIYTARSKVDKSLMGYAGYVVNVSIQNKTIKESKDLGVFLKKEFRHGGLGLLLLDFADFALVKDGVNLITYNSPAANPEFGRILAQRGFKKADEVYIRSVPCQ